MLLIPNSSCQLFSLCPKGRVPFGDLQVHVCSNHSMPLNCPKYSDHSQRDGCFLGNSRPLSPRDGGSLASSRIMCFLIILQHFVFFPKGRLPFVEFQIQICSRYSTFYNNNNSLICSKEGYLFGEINIHTW